MVAMGLGLLITANANAFLNCPVDDPGGVSLDKTLTMLGDMESIASAAYDPYSGEILFVGKNFGTANLKEKIDLDDLVVAARTVYSVDPATGVTPAPGINFYALPDSLATGRDGVEPQKTPSSDRFCMKRTIS
ncbi:MAG: hypothetical protein D6706_13340 [Chloroflexi bacterium]|nr:MAG: hypothetical protein D6706_13340 [Chloroflexota bacterium]